MEKGNSISRRKFIQQSAVLGAGILFAGTNTFSAKEKEGKNMSQSIKSRGYAAKDASVVKPNGFVTQVGMPVGFEEKLSNIGLAASRVNYNASLIGGIPETQEVANYCADNKIHSQIQIIKAEEINDVWTKVLNKEARYRFVIDAATF